MKSWFFLPFLLLALVSSAQVQKGKYLSSGTFRLRNYYEGANPHKYLQIGFANKTGYFLIPTIAVGLKAGYTWTHARTRRDGTLQQGGSQWYEKGIFNRHDYAVGVFADKYFRLAKSLYITAGVYAQYDHYTEVENGDYFDQNDEYIGVSYRMQSYSSKVAQLGLTNSLVYFLNQRWGINCLLSSLDVTINKSRAAELDLRAPVMNLGIQYHFPK